MDITPYIGPVVTAAIFIVGSYIAMKNAFNTKFEQLSVQIASLTTKVDDLRDDVEKHNSMVERTFKLESDVHTAFKRIDDLKAADEKLGERIEKFHG